MSKVFYDIYFFGSNTERAGGIKNLSELRTYAQDVTFSRCAVVRYPDNVEVFIGTGGELIAAIEITESLGDKILRANYE